MDIPRADLDSTLVSHIQFRHPAREMGSRTLIGRSKKATSDDGCDAKKRCNGSDEMDPCRWKKMISLLSTALDSRPSLIIDDSEPMEGEEALKEGSEKEKKKKPWHTPSAVRLWKDSL